MLINFAFLMIAAAIAGLIVVAIDAVTEEEDD